MSQQQQRQGDHSISSSSMSTPSPQSVLSPQVPTPHSPDLVHDLPPELLERGWRKFWSKRERRPYFFNKETHQSLWEMSEIPASPQPFSFQDPLGISVSDESGGNNANSDGCHSEDATPGSNSTCPSGSDGGGGGGGGGGGDAATRRRRPSEVDQAEAVVAGDQSSQPQPQHQPQQQPQPQPQPPQEQQQPQSQQQHGRDVASAAAATKRPHSDACSNSEEVHPRKKPALKMYWDFDIESNVLVPERAPSAILPPHPDIEILRYDWTKRLRLIYQELCHGKEGIEAPKGSFNRWLMERKLKDRGHDPVLPGNCAGEMVSPSMLREILGDLPIRLRRPKFSRDARQQLLRYAEAAKKKIESSNVPSDSRKIVKWNAEDIFQWVRRSGNNASLEEIQERLNHMRSQCGPVLSQASMGSARAICAKVFQSSAETVQRIHSRHCQLLREYAIEPEGLVAEPPHPRVEPCAPFELRTQLPRLPRVDQSKEADRVFLEYQNEVITINQEHYLKLRELYRLSQGEGQQPAAAQEEAQQLSRMWCMLKRYQTFFGVSGQDLSQDSSLHASLTEPVFKCLHQQFGVSFECFASPLNCYFRQYCSAFPDTDGWFGSRGTLLDFSPVRGSFEANPPFSEELMEATVNHFESLLDKTSQPLSFIYIMPNWRNPPTPALVKMEASRFKKKQLLIEAYQHEYKHGMQHSVSKSELYFKAAHGTLVFFLQNEAGHQEWRPTEEKMDALRRAFATSKGSSDHKEEYSD